MTSVKWKTSDRPVPYDEAVAAMEERVAAIAAGQAGAECEARHDERQGRSEAGRSGHTSLLNGPGALAGPSLDTLQAARVPVSLPDLLEKWREVSFFQWPYNDLAAFP